MINLPASASRNAFHSVCEAHSRVYEVQALLSAVAAKACGEHNEYFSVLSGIERLVQGISDQITHIERDISDLERQLEASASPKALDQDVLGSLIQELSADEKATLFKLIQEAKAQTQGVAA